MRKIRRWLKYSDLAVVLFVVGVIPFLFIASIGLGIKFISILFGG